jgi:hypothetical protein
METLSEPLLATAKSSFPSPLKSAATTAVGLVPVAYSVGANPTPCPCALKAISPTTSGSRKDRMHVLISTSGCDPIDDLFVDLRDAWNEYHQWIQNSIVMF